MEVKISTQTYQGDENQSLSNNIETLNNNNLCYVKSSNSYRENKFNKKSKIDSNKKLSEQAE